MLKRVIEPVFHNLIQQYPVLTITGPRQSGKTTLCRSLRPNWPYVNLEDPPARDFIKSEPKRFLAQYPDGVIIDEFQRFPDITSYIQVIADENKKNGQFILTGSQSFESMAHVSQSLAGRTAILRLLPFSLEEVHGAFNGDIDDLMLNGFYPRLYDQHLNPSEYYSFYLNTYVERDIRQLVNIKDLDVFQKFVSVCASRTGQVVNFTSIGNDCGLSHNTVKEWINLLSASFIIGLVQPYFQNLGKRLTKSPKIYFMDTGLACFLLDIRTREQLMRHPLRGALFETFIHSEMEKYFQNRGPSRRIYFFRENNGLEADFLVQRGNIVDAFEAKASELYRDDMALNLKRFRKLAPGPGRTVLFNTGESSYVTPDGIELAGWRGVSHTLDKEIY